MCKYVHPICPFILMHEDPYKPVDREYHRCDALRGVVCEATNTSGGSGYNSMCPPHPDFTTFRICDSCKSIDRVSSAEGAMMPGHPCYTLEAVVKSMKKRE